MQRIPTDSLNKWIDNAQEAENVKSVLDCGIRPVIDLAFKEPSIQDPSNSGSTSETITVTAWGPQAT
jgi:hypothetical protein